MSSSPHVKRLGWPLLLATVLAMSACFGGQSNPPPRTIRIGVDLPLSGAEAQAAEPALNGIRFYVQTHPTLDGFRISLREADDAADPNQGASNIRAFLTDPSLLAVLGPYDAAVARLEIPVANAAGLAMVSPATSNPCLTRDLFVPARLNPSRIAITCKEAGLPGASSLRPIKTNNFFRLTTTDDLQGAAAAEYAIHKMHLLRAAVISDHETYGQGLAYAFTARFTTLGGLILGHTDLDPAKPSASASDFLTQAKAAGAQAIYYGGSTRAGGCEIRAEMARVFADGGAAPLLGGDGIALDPACVTAAGPAAPGIYATVPIVDAQSRPATAPTIQKFKAAFGSAADYGPYTLVAYDAAAVVYAALDRAIREVGSSFPTREAVTQDAGQLDGVAGTTGTLSFDRAGDTTNRVISVYETTAADPRGPWKLVDSVDYSAHLPY